MKVKIWTKQEFMKNEGELPFYWNHSGEMDYLYGKIVDAEPIAGGYDDHYLCIDNKWRVAKKHVHILEKDLTIRDINGKMLSSPIPSLIRNVYFNAEKGVTTVILQDGKKGMSRCHEGDEYDMDIGFALALTNALFGSRTQAHKYADKCLDKQTRKTLRKKTDEIISNSL